MGTRRALVIPEPGSIGLQDVAEVVPGHEWSGVVEAVGPGVTGLLSSGRLRLGPLITHRFPLDRFGDAYQALRESDGPRGKVMLDLNLA